MLKRENTVGYFICEGVLSLMPWKVTSRIDCAFHLETKLILLIAATCAQNINGSLCFLSSFY